MRRVMARRKIVIGNAIQVLQSTAAAEVDSIVTSPPYFRLRNYGVSGQLGLESAVTEWVDKLRAVAAECARVMVPTGTLWLNLGDSFSIHRREGAPPKSLLLAPERLAAALSDDGWILRNKIVWAKPSTTPSSVRDRLSTKYEVVYLFVRARRYFFDLDAIRVPHATTPKRPRPVASLAERRPGWLGPNSDGDAGLAAMHAAGIAGHPLGKNPGDVWTMGVSRFRGAHFATFPSALVERAILAGTPELRCSRCRTPHVRELRRSGTTARRLDLQPRCTCHAPPEPGLVLDPFMGAGTTAVVAESLDRDWAGIELNPDYVQLAEERIATARSPGTNQGKEVA